MENITIAVPCKNANKIFICEGLYGHNRKNTVCLDFSEITERFSHGLEEMIHGDTNCFMVRGERDNSPPIYFESISEPQSPLHAFSLIAVGHRHREKYTTPWAEIRFSKEAIEELAQLKTWISTTIECKTLKIRRHQEKRPALFQTYNNHKAVLDQAFPLGQIHIDVAYFFKKIWIWVREGDFKMENRLFFPAATLLNFLNNPRPKEGFLWCASSDNGGKQGAIVLTESKIAYMKIFCLQSSKTNNCVRMNAETFAGFFSLRPWLCEVIENLSVHNIGMRPYILPLHSELHSISSVGVIPQRDSGLDTIIVCSITLPSSEQVIFVREGIEDFRRTYFGALTDFHVGFQAYFSKNQNDFSNLFFYPDGKNYHEINQTEDDESAIRLTDKTVRELWDWLQFQSKNHSILKGNYRGNVFPALSTTQQASVAHFLPGLSTPRILFS